MSIDSEQFKPKPKRKPSKIAAEILRIPSAAYGNATSSPYGVGTFGDNLWIYKISRPRLQPRIQGKSVNSDEIAENMLDALDTIKKGRKLTENNRQTIKSALTSIEALSMCKELDATAMFPSEKNIETAVAQGAYWIRDTDCIEDCKEDSIEQRESAQHWRETLPP